MYTITVMVMATEIMNLLTADYAGHLLITCMASVLVDSRSKKWRLIITVIFLVIDMYVAS